jgi:predicted AAA+ superfamily ATPase
VISKAPKFYLFDVGVAGALTKRRISAARGEQFGKAFEHFILMEMVAHSAYSGLNYDIHFWRTKSGLEVDFILGDGEVAVEVKGTSRLEQRELRPLAKFVDTHHPRRAIVVCNEPEPRLIGNIHVLPWRHFTNQLWNGAIIGE